MEENVTVQLNHNKLDQDAIVLNTALLKNKNKFGLMHLTPAANSAEEGMRYALTLNRNLSCYGYTLSKDLLEEISKLSKEQIKKVWDILSTSVENVLNAESFRDRTLFYPNFPEEVMEKSDAELYLNSLVYYIGNAFGIDTQESLVEEPVKRTPVLDLSDKPLKVIEPGSLADVYDLMDERIHGLSMSKEKEDELNILRKIALGCFMDAVNNDHEFASKENLVKTMNMLYESGYSSFAERLVKDAPDVLRFIAIRSNCNLGEDKNRIDLGMKPKDFVLSLNKEEKKLVKNMLNRCKNLYADIWKQPDLWKKAMRYIGFDKRTPERVRKAFNNLANNRKVTETGRVLKTPAKWMQDAVLNVRDGELNSALKFAENFPGMYVANVIEFVKNCKTEEDATTLSNKLREVGKDLPPVDLMKLVKRVYHINDDDYEYFKNRHGKVFVKENAKDFPENYKLPLMAAISGALYENMKDTKDLGKVYIDPALEDHVVPLRGERNASYNASLSKYSNIPMTEDNLLCFGISWTERNLDDDDLGLYDHVDMDLSVAAYDEDMNRMEYINYQRLKSFWGCHSGDYTHGLGKNQSEPGSMEMIYCDKELMKKKGIRYLVPEISGFNREFQKDIDLRFVSFEKDAKLDSSLCKELEEGYCQSISGEPLEYTEIHSRSIGVSGNSRQAIPMIYDVQKNKGIWLDEAYDNRSPFVNVRDSYGKKLLKASVEHTLHQHYPTMKDLFALYAETCGKRNIEDFGDSVFAPIEEADTVFLAEQTRNRLGSDLKLKEGAELITSAELEKISTDFLARQPKLAKELSPEEEIVKKEDLYSLMTEAAKEARRLEYVLSRDVPSTPER